jgi:hypothetical protein
MHGSPTLDVEVTNISGHGFWMLVDGREFFLPYADFPWFRTASVQEICDVKQARPGHFRWSMLDVDLDIKSIENPEQYPLVAR